MMDLRDILEDWENKKEIYEQLTTYIEKTLRDLLVKHGIQARIVSRTKDEVSIAKKLYRDGVTFQNYSAMRDKSEDMERVAKSIREEFRILKEEDKSSLLKLNEIGYRSLHFDIKLREEVASREKLLDLGNLFNI
jgi:ppGpp synthetase/RelA/SpoT-type nucleotidyltranferase